MYLLQKFKQFKKCLLAIPIDIQDFGSCHLGHLVFKAKMSSVTANPLTKQNFQTYIYVSSAAE